MASGVSGNKPYINVPTNSSPDPKICGACEKEGAQLVCERCRLIRYCNADCQKPAWKTHKLVCQKPIEATFRMMDKNQATIEYHCLQYRPEQLEEKGAKHLKLKMDSDMQKKQKNFPN